MCRFFNWLGFAEQQKQEEEERQQQELEAQQQQPQQHQHGGIPREFPGIVYRTLRFYPDAMKALARAIKEFYQGTYAEFAADMDRQYEALTTRKEPPKAA